MTTIGDVLAVGLEHHQAGRLQQAEQIYRQVLAYNPRSTDALHLLGVLAMQAGHLEQAVPLIEQAVALNGRVPAYHNNLGEAFRRLGRWDDAEAAYRRATALDERFADAHNNLGTVHQHRGNYQEALAAYERAIACDPEKFNAHYNRARAWLALGDYERGWAEYEWRWRRPEFEREKLDLPEWDGAPLAGRRLLVRWEQGLGDTLQFMRYVKVLQQAGEQVTPVVQGELVGLLRDSGFERLVAHGDPLPACDLQVMLLSLPHRMGTRLDTVPANVPYLAADPARVARWRERLAAVAAPFKLGVCWQGNPQSPHEPYRSVPLIEFAPLASVAGVQLVSLQRGYGRDQSRALANRFKVLDWDVDDRNPKFEDTAALMQSLDLVITSDTANAHLAGGLAREVWVALPVSADPRWLIERSDSPWYPTMRLFRQRRAGDWSGVFEQIRAALIERVKHAIR